MKKILFAMCALVVTGALFFSCTGKDSQAASSSGTKQESAMVQKSASSRVIYSGWILYEERDDGKMYAVNEAETGDGIKIYLNEDDSVEQKNAVRHLQSGKEEAFDFIRVQYEEKDNWTRDIFVSAPEVELSWVMTEDAFAYSSPDIASITGTQVDEGTFIAAADGQIEGTNGFYKVVIYNGRPFGKEIYLQKDTFSYKPMIKESARFFSKVKADTDPEVLEEVILKFVDILSESDSDEKDYFVRKFFAMAEKTAVTEKTVEAVKTFAGESNLSVSE